VASFTTRIFALDNNRKMLNRRIDLKLSILTPRCTRFSRPKFANPVARNPDSNLAFISTVVFAQNHMSAGVERPYPFKRNAIRGGSGSTVLQDQP